MPVPNYELQLQFDKVVVTTERLVAREKQFTGKLLFEALSHKVFKHAC